MPDVSAKKRLGAGSQLVGSEGLEVKSQVKRVTLKGRDRQKRENARGGETKENANLKEKG